jgi:hypothetical protein
MLPARQMALYTKYRPATGKDVDESISEGIKLSGVLYCRFYQPGNFENTVQGFTVRSGEPHHQQKS